MVDNFGEGRTPLATAPLAVLAVCLAVGVVCAYAFAASLMVLLLGGAVCGGCAVWFYLKGKLKGVVLLLAAAFFLCGRVTGGN